MNKKPTPFAARLRTLREAAGFSQRALAKAAGLSQQAVNDLERGRFTDPKLSTIRGLAAALGVRPAELIG